MSADGHVPKKYAIGVERVFENEFFCIDVGKPSNIIVFMYVILNIVFIIVDTFLGIVIEFILKPLNTDVPINSKVFGKIISYASIVEILQQAEFIFINVLGNIN